MADGWHNGELAPYDLETTAPNPLEARIVTACVGHISGGRGNRRSVAIRQWLLDPGIEIPVETTRIHGITTEKARAEGSPAAAGVEQIVTALWALMQAGVVVVGHNISYDLTVLDRECRRHGLPTLGQRMAPRHIGPIADSYVLDKQYSRRKGSRRLEAVAEHYGARLSKAHDATEDALAAARIVWRICEANPTLAQMDLTTLYHRQVAWRDKQQRSLATYFKGIGEHEKAADVLSQLGWPVVPHLEPEPQQESLI